MEDLNLIWQTVEGEQTEFEFEYTTEQLFKNFRTNCYFDHGTYKTVKDNSVIIYSNDNKAVSPEFIHYLNHFVRRGLRLYLLHFSNESLNHDYWYYSKANYVFRNYFDPGVKMPNVLFIPLGFKSGYLNKKGLINDCAEKTIDAAFIGQPKSDRFALMAELEKLPSYYTHKTNAWNCSTALTQQECIEIYKKTKYAPCPMGNVHPDSFRLCESLEWGCIPVVRNVNGSDYFKNVFGDHPFKVVDEWSEIAAIVLETNYCESREGVHSWYLNFKESLQLKIQNIIETGGIKNGKRHDVIKDLKSETYRVYRILRGFAKRIYHKIR